MATELDDMLARTDRKIAQLRETIRLEELWRERILEEIRDRQSHGSSDPHATGIMQDDTGGDRTLSSRLVEGSLASRIIGVLQAAGKPMKAKDIAAKVQEQGFTTNAKAGLLGSVASRLSRGLKTGKFVRKGRGRYALKADSPQETA